MRRLLFGAGVGLVLTSMATLPSSGAQPATASTSPPAVSQGRWAALDSGTTADLEAVSFSEARSGHVVGAGGTIMSTTDAGKTWRRQFACIRTKPCRESSEDRVTADLTGVGFWDTARGVAAGTGGVILVTTDGGGTWTSRRACEGSRPCRADSPDRTTADVTAVSVVHPSHAYAVGKAGTMLASENFGKTWRRLPTCALDAPVGGACADSATSTKPADLATVVATSASVVHAAGPGGALFGTANGVKAFHPIPICVNDEALSQAAIRENEARLRALPRDGRPPPLAQAQPQENARSACVQASGTRPINPDLAGVAFIDPRRHREDPRIEAVGKEGTIVSGAGAGAWTPQFACATSDPCAESSPDRVRSDLRAVAFPNDLAGYAVGSGGTIISRKRPPDAPVRRSGSEPGSAAPKWRPEDSGVTKDLNAVSFPTPDAGYAVGDGGTVVKLTAPAPGVIVRQVRPLRGPTVGRTEVQINGRGFTGATDVYFGRSRALGFNVDSDTQITVTAPARPAGTVTVSVITPGGPSPAVAAGRFTYVAPGGGAWEPTKPCPSGCGGPAVALPDGTVLTTGASTLSGGGGPAATDVYDPATRTWTAVEPLHEPRADHTVTALSDGKVLVAGGVPVTPPGSGGGAAVRPPGTELYDPAARMWSAAGDVVEARGLGATATLLADGKVLVVGSVRGLTAAEIYDPRSRAWSPTAPMSIARAFPTATRLRDGTVLVVGGCSRECAGVPDSTEIYDPASGTWQRRPSPKTAHASGTATLMANGDVLVVGGTGDSANVVPFAERYDAKTGTWAPIAPMRVPRARHSATLLADGRLLVAGGVTDDPTQDTDLGTDSVASAEIYDPETDRWSLVADMPVSRLGHTALLLQEGCGPHCGKVLIAGGERCGFCTADRLEPPVLYEPVAARRSDSAAKPGGGIGAAGALLVGGGLLVVAAALLLGRKARR